MSFYNYVKEVENIEQKNALIKVGEHLKEVILATSKSGQRKEVLYAINENAAMPAQQEVFKQLADNKDYYFVLSIYLEDILGKEFNIKITDIKKDESMIRSFYVKVSWK